MTSVELAALLVKELKGLSSYVVSDDYTNAISEAQQETGWTLPLTVDFQILWFKRRTKRHIIYALFIESASKFKVDQINLGERFKHYGDIIKMEDDAFERAKEERPDLFLGIDPEDYFGQVAGTGHSYDEMGCDITDYADVFDALQQR
jgi:hypothetical protein